MYTTQLLIGITFKKLVICKQTGIFVKALFKFILQTQFALDAPEKHISINPFGTNATSNEHYPWSWEWKWCFLGNQMWRKQPGFHEMAVTVTFSASQTRFWQNSPVCKIWVWQINPLEPVPYRNLLKGDNQTKTYWIWILFLYFKMGWQGLIFYLKTFSFH